MGKYAINVLPVVLCEGQSNSIGAGLSGSSTYPLTNSNIFIYYKGDNTVTDNGALQTINNGTNTTYTDTLCTAGRIGYQCSLMEQIHTYLGVDSYIISPGRGSTFLYYDDTALNFNKSGEGNTVGGNPQLYDVITKYYWKPGITRMASKGILKIKAIISEQGENDMNNATRAAAYQVNQINKYTAFRSQPNLYGVKVVNFIPDPLAAGYTSKSTVQTAMTTNASANPTWLTNIDISDLSANLGADQIHYLTSGYEIMGTRAFNLIKDN